MEIDSCFNPNSDTKSLSHVVSFTTSVNIIYFIAVVDKPTTDCRDVFQITVTS